MNFNFKLNTKLDSFLYANILGWVFLLTLNTSLYILLSIGEQWLFEVDFYLKGIFLNVIFLLAFFTFRYLSEKERQKQSPELLRGAFQTGFWAVLASIVLRMLPVFFTGSFFRNNLLVINFNYYLDILLLSVFLHHVLFTFRTLVLREAAPSAHNIWNIYTYILIASLIFSFFEFDLLAPPATLTFVSLLVITLMLSVNTHWVAYLSAREKLEAMGWLALQLLCCAYFFFVIFSYYQKGIVSADLAYSVYLLGVLACVVFYIVMAVLVVVFNIPTTSVFERKIREIISFQELTQSLQMEGMEKNIYQTLLQNAHKITQADAAWVEVLNRNGKTIALLHENISLEQVYRIKAMLRKQRLQKVVDNTFERNLQYKNQVLEGFASVLTKPLVARDAKVGSLTLLKVQEEGFNDSDINLIDAFAKQTSVAIENRRLLEDIIDGERYKQELAIAQQVQQSLLPRQLNINDDLEIDAFAFSAKEVGGDYYDLFAISPTLTYVIIGDVSGKGTSAAFNMAQMKGIFQSLALINPTPQQFMWYANQALINCLDKSSFITVTLLLIDTAQKQVSLCRAGHCPTLYFEAKNKRTYYLEDKGMGLGIVRSKKYLQFIKTTTLSYQKDDLLMLYTDGITEAKNIHDDEYGYERLQAFVHERHTLPAAEIHSNLLQDLSDFCQGTPVHDDYTSILIRFR
mgnify:CR=1 FL=1